MGQVLREVDQALESPKRGVSRDATVRNRQPSLTTRDIAGPWN